MKNNNNKNNRSVPIPPQEKFYSNSDTCKVQILDENKNKSGIYMWTNNINNKRYIGSSKNLRKRFLQYFNINYLIRDNCMQICRALLKHGNSNFSLTILEYCEPSKCLIREKHYWDIFNPEYNIAKDPVAPFSGHTHSDDTKKIMSEVKKGKPKIEGSGTGRPYQAIEVFNKENNQTTTYDSISEAARALNISQSTITNYILRSQQKPYKGIYTFKKV